MARKPVRKGRPKKADIKTAADRAERRARGEKVEIETKPSPLNPPEVKRKPGRPTKYDPAMCGQVIELGEAGKSKAQIARSLGVTRETIDIWANQHQEFSDAIKIARDLSLAWWEDKGQDAITLGPKEFNATAFIFQMKNRFREEYRDSSSHEVTGKDGKDLIPESAGTRDVARAIYDIFRTAALEPEEPKR